ncbi:MAG TPA: rod shape-determining protein RodA [Symbiobacteriaceae bacterium]
MNFDARLLRHIDKLLVLIMFALIVFGVIVVSSAARGYVGPDKAMPFVNRQVLAAGIGLFLILIALVFDYTEFGRMTWIIYGLNVFLLAVVLVLGKATNGAVSWIRIGGFQFQPSEFGKVMLILTLGQQLSRMDRIDRLLDLVAPALHVLPLMALVLVQNDLGTTLVFVVITAVMLYMAGFPGWKMLAIGVPPLAAVGGWLYAHLRWGVSMWPLQPHQIKRLVTFVNPNADPLDSGWQVLQSRISIGSGGLLGQGLYHGTQNQLGFLPEQHTDFIFSVVGEELGFAGGILLIVLFLVLLWRIMAIAGTAKDGYGALIATGVAGMIGFHVLESLGMTMGVMPMTGIPLPFISYGGSAMMADMLAVGLVLNVGMRRQKIMF